MRVGVLGASGRMGRATCQAVQEAAANLQKLEATESDKYARDLGATACSGG